MTPWPLPAGVARHTGGRDARRVAVARSSPPPPSLTDHQRDDARRAVACLVTTAAPADDADVLAAARLGVVPVDTADSGAALAADAMAWEAASTRMREQVADRHRPAQAAASLATPHG